MSVRSGISVVLLAAAACWAGPALAGAVLDPQEAPDWRVDAWLNGDPGPLGTHTGRVLVVHFFQMWCPGSNNFSIPTMQQWDEKWGDRDDFMVVSIHSVFEGFPFQTPELLQSFVRDRGIRHPVGVDAHVGAEDPVPVTMKRFQAGGTPHLAIIDKEGRLVFHHFGVFDVPTVEFYVERLLKEETDHKPTRKPNRADSLLTGTYRLRLEEVSRSCGPVAPPRELSVRVEAFKQHLAVDFPSPFLGADGVSLNYQPAALSFDAAFEHRTKVGADPVQARAKIRGLFVRGSNPPAVEYELTYLERSPNAARNCDVQVRGTGVRVGE